MTSVLCIESMAGARSDGSSATVGMQNVRRDQAVQAGFDQSIVGSGTAVTYRFNAGSYVEERTDSSPPGTPVVSDGGAERPVSQSYWPHGRLHRPPPLLSNLITLSGRSPVELMSVISPSFEAIQLWPQVWPSRRGRHITSRCVRGMLRA